jgi:TPR repeat protein
MISATHTHIAGSFGQLLLLLAAPVFAGHALQVTPDTLVAGTPDVNRSQQDNLTKSRPGTLAQELQLARKYLTGDGVVRDPSQSAYWYRKAADRGDPSAQVQLGYFYLAGIGVGRDEQEAAKWFERAAGSGSRTAKLNMAVMYLKGAGVPHDPQLGFSLLTELAKQGDPRSEGYLGLLYHLGIGVKKDPVAAEKWFDKAAKQHNPEGEYAMGTLYSNDASHVKDLQKAVGYFRSSAKAGYVLSMHSLGFLLLTHPELPQQADESFDWLQAAAGGGSWRSAVMLGVVARDGRRGPADLPAACRWFTIAEQQGGTETGHLLNVDLARCGTALSPEQRKQTEQAAADWIAAHPHKDVYVFEDGQQNNYFPLAEVYATDQAKIGSGEGAHIY